jgi:hypothetical protein
MIVPCVCGAYKGHDYDCATAGRLYWLEQEVYRLRAALDCIRRDAAEAVERSIANTDNLRRTTSPRQGSDG